MPITQEINKRIWRIFLINLILIVVLCLSGLSLGFIVRTNRIIYSQLLNTAKSHFNNILLTRRWNAEYNGVYVEKIEGVHSNPYLENPDITTIDGKVYTKKNPALMTREMSEYAEKDGNINYHITSLKPLNPSNAPDSFEQATLKMFESGTKELSTTVIVDGQTVFRYMAPLYVEKSCLKCHKKQGYSVGDVRGGISISFDISDTIDKMTTNNILVALISFFTISMLILVIYLMVSRTSSILSKAYETISKMAITDDLTQLFNRRKFFDCLSQEISRSKRYNHPLSLLMLDIDLFKKINDIYGHQIGDMVLSTISEIIRSEIRTCDIAARYGGEEIMILLPETDFENACICADKIRSKIEDKVFTIDNQRLCVTASLGVASLGAHEADENHIAHLLVKNADISLYKAKEAGRNRVR